MTEIKKEPDDSLPMRNPESIGIILKGIVNEIAASVSLSDFQQKVTTLKNKPTIAELLYNMHKTDILNENHQIIDKMSSETGLYEKYVEITKLMNDSEENNSVAWRPVTGDCDMQLAAYRKKHLINKKQKLEKLVNDQQCTRILLKHSLDKKRRHVKSLLNDMENAEMILLHNDDNLIEK